MMPVFGMRALWMLVVPAALLAVIVLFVAGRRGTGVFKKQGVAWFLTIVMIVAAIGIGYNKAHASSTPEPIRPPETVPPSSADYSFVWDDANVLSSRTVRALDERNDRLWNNYGVTIGVVTCNYGWDDLDSYALECAEDMGLGGYDFIVVLDISGDNYWLVQGADLVRDFSDQTCSDYAYDYMEEPFAWGDYDSAVLQLTEMLEAWYGVYYF